MARHPDRKRRGGHVEKDSMQLLPLARQPQRDDQSVKGDSQCPCWRAEQQDRCEDERFRNGKRGRNRGELYSRRSADDGQCSEYEPLISHRVSKHLQEGGTYRHSAREDHTYNVGTASRRKRSILTHQQERARRALPVAPDGPPYRRVIGRLGPNDYGRHFVNSWQKVDESAPSVAPNNGL